jgi:hypothetical protein
MAAITKRYAFLKPDLADVEVSFPKVTAGAGVCSSFAVLKFGDLEVEVNDSGAAMLPEFFEAGSAIPDGEITLSTGWPVAIARIDAASGGGICFGIKVGDRVLLGSVPATTSLEKLAGWLSDLRITATDAGLTVRPTRATWSPDRQANIVLGVTLRSGQSSLLDIRPAFKSLKPARSGVAVDGGYLSRQGNPDQQQYLVLNSSDHVVYILSPSGRDRDEVAELGSGVTVRSVAG